MDGTGISTSTLDAVQNKYHSCFLGSDEVENMENAESTKKAISSGSGVTTSVNPEQMWMNLNED